MVALLWQLGAVDDAIELEMQWNRLMHDHDFSLLCAYPTGVFDHASLVDVRRVCELHTDLVPTHPLAAQPDGPGPELAVGHACSRIYLPIPESVPAARHFVVDVLRSWGNEDLTADAALIISELATNALSHAMSPFRAVLDRRGGGLRIGVEDATDIPLERRNTDAEDTSGRGVAIIEALSERWGYSAVPGGKVVWAELPLNARRWQAG
jgi:anti-sigma regulatory factor (Ser/Thr protein kinase)